MQSADGCGYPPFRFRFCPRIQFPGFRNAPWNVHPGLFRLFDQFHYDASRRPGNLLPDHPGYGPGCHRQGSRTVLCIPAQKIILFLYEIPGSCLHRNYIDQLHCKRFRLDQYVRFDTTAHKQLLIRCLCAAYMRGEEIVHRNG